MDSDTEKIRNICILAHVDHGKTTLADHLIAASGRGLLHPKLAGKVRIMDYLDEEQRRAITMKSSSICLSYKEYSINLIDSPGHMDFCSEVSTAARLSDGALVLVDVVEGVHIQTHAVLRQSWIEKVTPCLVLNKIDKLISELKMSPMEAYNQMSRIIHEVNGIISGYKSEKYLSDVDSILAGLSPGMDDDGDKLKFMEDEEDEEDAFQPQKGNVAFVCALDGWGFRINEFAEFYASKFGASSSSLLKSLWGPRYFNPKKKMIVGKKALEEGSRARPMFVQFVLEPLWQVYQSAFSINGGNNLLEKVIRSFNLNVPAREIQNKDPKSIHQAVMSRWLPLSDAVFSMVVNCMPNPIDAQSHRISRLLPQREVTDGGCHSDVVSEAVLARKSVESCDSSSNASSIAFVSKMFAVPIKHVSATDLGGGDDDDDDHNESEECFLAFARIFSGVLRSGQRIFVLSALYDPSSMEMEKKKHVHEARIRCLYLMMGQGLKPVASAKAGNLVAIQGLDQHILKTATLSSTRNFWPFSSMVYQVSPTLKVAVEPSDPADMNALVKGLKLLNRADPFVEVSISSRGEHVVSAAGEVHLERCVQDLKERFAKVSLEVSPPLVSYKETIEGDSSSFMDGLRSLCTSSDFVEKTTPNGSCVVRVQVLKLPPSFTKFLDENSDLLSHIVRDNDNPGHSSKSLETKLSGIMKQATPIETIKKWMIDAMESDVLLGSLDGSREEEKKKPTLEKFSRRILALGPRQTGPNILLAPAPPLSESESINGAPLLVPDSRSEDYPFHVQESLRNSIVSGFQLATASGPLCDEPMWGLAFVIDARARASPLRETEADRPEQAQDGIMIGQVMTAVKDACRDAVLQKKPRLVEAMYFCELDTPTEHLGSTYAVLNRKRARVLKEEMREGSPFFTVHAYVPVSESFGFAEDLRRWTSGAATALLVLSHWEELPQDPFFIPKTEEELEEFGDGSSVLPNTTRRLIDATRRRKGLPVEEKVVRHATKQRTLARKV